MKLIEMARDWIREVLSEGEEEGVDPAKLSDKQVKEYICKNYDGGWPQFKHDSKL